MFELRDLECFMEIVEHRSFGRAAAALGMTQPALSRRIAVLERGLGAALFSRAHRQIEVTSAGEVFAREAIGVLAQAAIAQRVLRDMLRGTSGHLKVGTRSSSRYVLIPEAIRRLRAEYPEVSVTLSDPLMGVHIEHLRKGVFDLTVMRGPVKVDQGLRSKRLRGDPLGVALPRGHRLARASFVDVGQLSEERFVEIGSSRSYGKKELLRGVCSNPWYIPTEVP